MPRLEEERLERDMETVFKYVIKWKKKKKDAKNKAKPKWLARTRSSSCSSQHFGALGSHHVPPPPPQQAAPSPIPINRLLMTFRSVRISLIIPRIRL